MQDECIRIPLANNQFALVDAEFSYLATGHKWHLDKDGYVIRGGGRAKIPTVKLHHLVLPLRDGLEVHHINGNKLDNRRANLQLVTHAQNCAGIARRKTNTSGYKGVSWEPRATAWRVYIRVNYRQIHLGHFKNLEDAARAYDAAAKEHFGEFAALNFPN